MGDNEDTAGADMNWNIHCSQFDSMTVLQTAVCVEVSLNKA